jgi:hypothetical protein
MLKTIQIFTGTDPYDLVTGKQKHTKQFFPPNSSDKWNDYIAYYSQMQKSGQITWFVLYEMEYNPVTNTLTPGRTFSATVPEKKIKTFNERVTKNKVSVDMWPTLGASPTPVMTEATIQQLIMQHSHDNQNIPSPQI